MKIFGIIAFVFVMLFALQANAQVFGNIDITPANQAVFMKSNDNVGILYTFRNNSDSRQCFTIYTNTNSPYLSASFPENNFCLNEGESTSMALTLQTTDAPKANYIAGILLYSEGGSYDIALARVTIGDNPAIEIIPYPTDVCRGKEEFINVLVRNKTPYFQTVKLNAENELLLPTFEQENVFLDSFGERNLKLFVHTSGLTRTGTQEASIYATTDSGEYIKKTAQIFVKDCEGIESPSFQVTFDSSCTAVEKTKSAKFYFSVKNLQNSSQTLNIAVLSDLPNYLGNSTVTLDAFEERTLSFDINARISDSNSDHNASLIVWNEKFRIEKSKCIKVRAANIAVLELLQNNLTIRRCESGIFVFSITNLGDSAQRVDFNVSNIPSNVSVSFSDKNFSLEKNTETEVFMYVSVAETAELRNYDLNVIAKIGSLTFQKTAFFKVIEKAPEIEEGVLSIESYPLQIQAFENSETTVSVKLRNNSSETIENISLSIKNLPDSIHASSATGIELFPSETKNIVLTLNIGKIPAGRYKAMLELQKDSQTTTREIEIIIGTAAQGAVSGSTSPFTGFFTIGQGLAFALVLLIIILLLAIAIIGLVVSKQERTLAIGRMR